MDAQQVKDAVREVFIEERGVDPELHAKHHRYIDDLLERARVRRERWEKARATVVGAVIVATVGGAGWILRWLAHIVIRAMQAKTGS